MSNHWENIIQDAIEIGKHPNTFNRESTNTIEQIVEACHHTEDRENDE